MEHVAPEAMEITSMHYKRLADDASVDAVSPLPARRSGSATPPLKGRKRYEARRVACVAVRVSLFAWMDQPAPSRDSARRNSVGHAHMLSRPLPFVQSLNYEEPFNINYLRRNAQLKGKRHFYGYTGGSHTSAHSAAMAVCMQ